MTESTNIELIEKAIAGNADAFGVLVERHQGLVRKQVAAHTPPWADRGGLMQDTFLTAYEKLTQLRNKEQFQSWLCRIAANHCHTWSRQQLRQAALPGMDTEPHEEMDPLLAVPSHDPLMRARLRSALARCSTRQRDVVLHHYVRGLSYHQTSVVLQSNTNTVRSRLQKARKRLRKELEKMMMRNSDENVLQLDHSMLAALRDVARVRGDDPQHPKHKMLQGTYLDKDGWLVATDGKCLIRRACREATKLSESTTILGCDAECIPDVDAATMSVGLTEAVLCIDGRVANHFQLQEGTYPDYSAVIPETWRYTFRLQREALLRGMAEIEPYLAARHPTTETCAYTPMVELIVSVPEQELSLRVTATLGYKRTDQEQDLNTNTTATYWEHKVVVCGSAEAGDGVADDRVSVCLNYAYLCHCVTGLGGHGNPDLDLRIIDADHQVVFQSCDQSGDMSVVMPFRLS